MKRRPAVHAASAILRDDGKVVLVREAAPGEEPSWSLPGGVLEDGELLHECLEREVYEETGLRIGAIRGLACVKQVDSRELGRHAEVLAAEYLLTVWTFEVGSWSGTLGPSDPDGVVLEAYWLPVPDAIAKLESSDRNPLATRYLRGEVEPGTLLLQRRHGDGRLEDVGCFVL